MKIPTHFKFLKEKEAKHWGCKTNQWIQIEEMHITPWGIQISSPSFAWISYNSKKNNLEFGIFELYKCKKCKERLVTLKEDVCENCYL